jgi:iron complex outermembrane receptor protein
MAVPERLGDLTMQLKHLTVAGFAAPLILALTPATVLAQEPADTAGGEAGSVEALVVLGRGQPRQVQTVDGSALEVLVPGASPIKALEQLPGVYFSGSDAFGNYEYAATLYLRGFSQTQLGFTLDGVPLGDMNYSNHNGLHISRATIGENIATAQLAQGASDLDAASTSNLGGTLRFISRRPADSFGMDVSAAAGSDDYRRIFAPLDSGEVGPTGLKASLAYADSFTGLWKGEGEQSARQVNFRIEQPVADGRLSFWVNGSQRRENDYLEQSRQQMARRGYFANYLQPDYDLAVFIADVANNRDDTGLGIVTNAAAGTDYPAGFETPDDAYYQGAGLRDDIIGALSLDLPVGERVQVSGTVYSHTNKGQGPWFTPYVPSPNALDPLATSDNSPLSFRGFSYDFTRWGALASAEVTLGQHRLSAGGWYESNHSREGYRYYGLDRDRPGRSSLSFQENPFYVDDYYSFETETVKLYVQDSWRPVDGLTLQFGFKALSVVSRATKEIEDSSPVAPGDDGYTFGEIEVEDSFLPQAGFAWRINPANEIFGSYGESVAAFASQAGGVNANGGQAAIDDAIANLEPERSRTLELGWRWRGERLEALVAAYAVRFDNRLAYFSASDSPILVSETIYRNVGSVDTLGLEATLRARFTDALSAMASYTYNHSEYQDDVLTDAGVLEIATRGKRVAGAPQDLLKLDLSYDDGALFASIAYAYNGEWFYTYENDNPVEAYGLVDLNLGYRFKGPWAKGLEISLNVSNLTDERYIAANAGLVERDPDGDQQVLLTGAPRTAFITLSKAF